MIRGGMLFDGTSTTPVPNPGIVIRDGKISCVGAGCEGGEDAVEIDATGLAVVPGLIDLHVHFLAITADNADLSLPRLIWNIARVRPDVRRKLLEAGVTSIRDVGGPQDAMFDLKAMLANGEIAGPRVFSAGPIFTAPGGHPAYGGNDPNGIGVGGNMAFQSNDVAAIRREVERLAERGVDGIKAVLHGAVSETGEVLLPTLSPAALEAIIETAKAHDLWTAVHVGPRDETRIAAELGATTVEHGIRMGDLVDEKTLRSLRENDVVYVPTLGREPQGHLNIPALYEAGVTIGVGTDTNNPEMSYGQSYHQELERLVAAGMPPAEVLLAATRNAARGIGASSDLGTIEVGKYADLVLVRGEPWRNIEDLRHVDTVIQNGRIVVDAPASVD
jgi:imidazolonepropionase-like amidohydrolase